MAMGFKHIGELLPDVFSLISDAQGREKNDPKPIYMPGKYESPIEDIFAWHLTKYLNPEVKFYAQYPIRTICGSFRIDFVIEHEKSRIAFECDGRNFHEPERDLWRDAMILGTDHIDVVFRLRGRDIFTYPIDLIYSIARFHSNIFSQRGHIQLLKLALESTLNSQLDKTSTSHLVDINDSEHNLRSFLEIDRRFRHTFKANYLRDVYYGFAQTVGGGSLDEVIKMYEQQF